MTDTSNSEKVTVNDDGTAAIYHRVEENEGFEKTVTILWELLQDFAEEHPSHDRILAVDIDGHRNEEGGFDAEMYGLQKDILLGSLLYFVDEVIMPMGKAERSDDVDRRDPSAHEMEIEYLEAEEDWEVRIGELL